MKKATGVIIAVIILYYPAAAYEATALYGEAADTLTIAQASNGMYCPECGVKNAAGAIYCANCGKKLPELRTEYNYCPKCGDKIDAGEAYCSNCGYAFKAVPAAKENTRRRLIMGAANFRAIYGEGALLLGPSATLGVRIGRYVSLNFETGYERNRTQRFVEDPGPFSAGYTETITTYVIPLLFKIKTNFLKTNYSPTAYVDVGYGILYEKPEYDVSSKWHPKVQTGGLLLGLGGGIDIYFTRDFGIFGEVGLRGQMTSDPYDVFGTEEKEILKFLDAGVGIIF